MFGVFSYEEIYRLLWDGNFADGGFRLGAGERQLSTGVLDVLSADEDSPVGYVYIAPA